MRNDNVKEHAPSIAGMPYLAGVVVQFAQESGAQQAGDECVTRLVVLHLRILIGRFPTNALRAQG